MAETLVALWVQFHGTHGARSLFWALVRTPFLSRAAGTTRNQCARNFVPPTLDIARDQPLLHIFTYTLGSRPDPEVP